MQSPRNPPAARAFGLPSLALVLVTMVWGGTFIVVQHGLSLSPPLFFVACRFAAAGLASAAFSVGLLRGLTRRELGAGLAIGLCIAVGYGAQTIGLQEIASSESAFLTALYIPMVPLLQWAVLKRAPQPAGWVAVALAFAGLVLLSGTSLADFSLDHGQRMTVFCAVAVALEIVLIGRFAPSVNARRVTIVQLLVASVAAFAALPVLGENRVPAFSWELTGLVLLLGLASALIQLTMNWAQRSVSPARAAVIYAGEPVWAGIVGRLAGERLPALALLGGALVVFSVLVGETRLRLPKLRVRLR